MRIAVIPARGGSKRIFKKNIKEFIGKPVIAYSIESAFQSKLFDHIVVSTDDVEIARIAKKYGAEVPFIRPEDISDDFSSATDVVAHAIEWAKNNDWDVNEVCCIYATAPFIKANDIIKGFKALSTGLWSFAFSATEYPFPIYRSFGVSEKGGAEMLYPEHYLERSQDLPATFHDAGQFYWGLADEWLSKKKIFDLYSKPIIIPSWRTQDIDTFDDWKRAELIWKALYL
tara:strand:- start:3978 stop:4664 length:687 start_codon:yes stop_codon:yes gene_type:complete